MSLYVPLTNRALGDLVPEGDHDTIRQNFDALISGMVPGGRLTGTTANPTGDSASTATLYYTPYLHNGVKLWDGSKWVFYNFSEISLNLAGLTTATNYDIFLYNDGGTLTLETAAWASGSARATDIERVNGVWVKVGANTRLYLGTIRTSATGQTIDSNAARFIWNMYHRIPKEIYIQDTTDSWTYGSGTFRTWNNNTNNIILMVRGRDEDVVDVTFCAATSGGNGCIALAPDAAGSNGMIAYADDAGFDWLTVRFCDLVGIGYRALYLSERSNSGTATFYGDSGGGLLSGARGFVKC